MPGTRGSGRLRRAIPLVALTGGLVIVAAVASGLQGAPAFTPPEFPGFTIDMPTIAPRPEDEGGAGTLPQPDPVLGAVFAWAGTGLVVLLLLVLAAVLARYLIARWRERATQRRAGATVDSLAVARSGLAAPATAEEDVRRAVERALDALDAPGETGDAIVAAWIGLEDTLQQAGVRRGDTETPAEFVVRVIARRGDADAEVRALLRLYENVRFGGVVPTDLDRAGARAALVAIEEAWR